MQNDQYVLAVPGDVRQKLIIGWLWLGVSALLASGVFSVLLVLSRTPGSQNFFPWLDFFHTALVVHVDLSVLVWFLAFAGVLWSLNCSRRLMMLGWAALIVSVTGTAIMVIAPFVADGHPVMSNYIPMLQQPMFIVGLLVFAVGIILLVLRAMLSVPLIGQYMTAAGSLRFGLNATAISVAMALMAFFWSWLVVPDFLEGKPYYELLYWGGGHVLQFTYTLLMLIGWVWLASSSNVYVPISPRVMLLLFAVGLFAVFLAPPIYYAYPVTSVEHVKLFTWLMRYGGSLATLPLAVALIYGLVLSSQPRPEQRPLRSALLSSMLLFGFGGLIGFFIQGSNVIIPAHYHGSIVGVTLALMGVTYELLPRLGYERPIHKMARWQPYLYGGGQLFHVIGLLWSGGYGVQRKVAGAEQGLEGFQQVAAMGLMGLGGLISIIGGLIFIYVVLQVMTGPRARPV
ncbi:MAG: cbb3-type cytochrome c oxidase subunit I [Proteobacteria bacterium]|nr:cbb3-type cytochrome c oxidase subunit I [Pseudomonadota bacterium]